MCTNNYLGVVVIFINLFVQTCALREFKIGGIFDSSKPTQEKAFKFAVELVNTERFPPFRLDSVSRKLDTTNTLLAYQETCHLMTKEILGLVGPNSPKTSPFIQSVCDYKEIPHIETHWYYQYERSNGFINVHPHPPAIQNVYVEVLRAWGWQHFTVIYENDENLCKIEKLLGYSEQWSVTLRQLELDAKGSYRGMLNRIKKSGEDHFVMACSTEVLEEFLQQAQQIGLVTEKQHYLVYNLDMHVANLEPFQYGGCNITGIRLLNPEDPEVISATDRLKEGKVRNRQKRPGQSQSVHRTLSTETALIIDAVRLFYEVLKNAYISLQYSTRPLNCTTTNAREYGFSIINDMKMKIIKGLTGIIRFDNEGFRSDFEVDIIELSVKGQTKVGTWNPVDGLHINREHEKEDPEDEDSLQHKSLIVIIALTQPYAMVKETTSRLYGNDRFEGCGIDLIQELSLILGFNYTFVVQEDGSNGKYNKETKTWDGMIGEIVSERAHLAITDLTITAEREEHVDFTLPFMNLGISILYRKPEPVPPSLFMFKSPFSGIVWMLLGVAYFTVSITLFAIARICPSEWTNPYPCVEEPEFLINQFSLRNSLWFTAGSLMQQGTEIAPIGISTRTLAGVWWFFTLIMVSSYTANLAAFLTVETLVAPFTSIEELANQTEIGYGAKAGGATAYFFRDSEKELYRKIWSYMYRHRDLMTQDNDEGVRRVLKTNYAFLMESTTIEYVTERQCTLAQVGGLLVEKGYGIAMKKGSKYRAALNAAILKLQETGTLTNLKIKWWKEKRGGGNCAEYPPAVTSRIITIPRGRSAGAAATSLNLQNVGGVFLVLAVGAVFGVLATFIELAAHTFKRSYRQKVDFKKEMRDEMKFFVKFRYKQKPQK